MSASSEFRKSEFAAVSDFSSASTRTQRAYPRGMARLSGPRRVRWPRLRVQRVGLHSWMFDWRVSEIYGDTTPPSSGRFVYKEQWERRRAKRKVVSGSKHRGRLCKGLTARKKLGCTIHYFNTKRNSNHNRSRMEWQIGLFSGANIKRAYSASVRPLSENT